MEGFCLNDRTVPSNRGQDWAPADNSIKVFGKDGRPIGSHAVNRTAASRSWSVTAFFGDRLGVRSEKS